MNTPENDALRHRETWDLIPWIVNGRGDESARRRAEEHLASCADCRAELAFQREIQVALRSEQEPEVHDPQPALRRLWARIDAQQKPSDAPPVSRVQGAAGDRRWLGKRLMQALVAAVAVEAMGLATLGAVLWVHTERATDYRTLSTPAVTVQAARIRAVFAPTMTLGAVQSLLAQQKLQIVAGPTSAGVYALAPLAAQPDDVLTATLQRLRAQPGVLFAEAIDPAR